MDKLFHPEPDEFLHINATQITPCLVTGPQIKILVYGCRFFYLLNKCHPGAVVFAKILTLVTTNWTLVLLVVLIRKALSNLMDKDSTLLAFCTMSIIAPVLPTWLKGSE